MKSAPQIGKICIQKLLKIFKLFLSSTSTSLFVKQKCASVGDKEPLLLNILTSVLCQFEACAIIWRQAVVFVCLQHIEQYLSQYKTNFLQIKTDTLSFLSLFWVHAKVCLPVNFINAM